MTIEDATNYYYSFLRKIIILGLIIIIYAIITGILSSFLLEPDSILYLNILTGHMILFILFGIIFLIYSLFGIIKLFGWNEYCIELSDNDFMKIMEAEGYSIKDNIYSKKINFFATINVRKIENIDKDKLLFCVTNYGGLFSMKIINIKHLPNKINVNYQEINKVLEHIPDKSYW